MGITCKLNWENLHVISSQKKIIWESLVKWTQIKFKGKSNERKREISKKEKKIEERKEKKRKDWLVLHVLCLGRLFSFSSMQPSKISWRGSRCFALISFLFYIFINLLFSVDFLKITQKSAILLVSSEFSQLSVSENTAGSPEIFTGFGFHQQRNHKALGWILFPITRFQGDVFYAQVLVDYELSL